MSAFGNRCVSNSADFARIKNLPRRTWTDAELETLAGEMTARLKTPEGTMRLRPKQALALHDYGVYGGLAFLGRVGTGKTLVSLMLPNMTAKRAERPLLLLPAGLIEKTEHDREILSKCWKLAPQLRLYSYDMLSRVDSADYLETYKFDLLILDEAHRAKNRRAGVTRRLLRYMQAHPETKVAVMSGTLIKKSLKDAAHLIRWALKEGAPVPSMDGEVEEWANALDEGVGFLHRFKPGPLLTLGTNNPDSDDTITARRAFQSRLIETPGVVSTAGEQVDCSLNIVAVRYPESVVANQHFETLRNKWETPDGYQFSEAPLLWMYARQLALDFHSIWDPRPPQEWVDARREWASFVRETLTNSRRLDTELQVRMAVEAGEMQCTSLAAWTAIKDTFIPNPKDVWHDTLALEHCEKWMKKNDGIVWCEHTFFARGLARRTGIPYFGQQALTEDGKSLVALAASKDAGKMPIICSVKACGTGQNLQAWNANLFTTCPTQAADLEQVLGRTHRDGQEADEVNVDIMLGSWEGWNAWNLSNAQAKATGDTYGDAHKLLMATVAGFPDEREVNGMAGARWKKNTIIKKLDIWDDNYERLRNNSLL